MSLPECIRERIGEWITSPRNEVFNIETQRYLLIKMNDEQQGLDCRFESRTPLRLHYWRFNHVIDMLKESRGDYIPIGSTLTRGYPDTVEGSLKKEALDKGYPNVGLRTAPFVCDLIVLCGYAEYGITTNPRTGRRVQGIRKNPELK